MSLRRFQNLQIGALTAQRMNELVDAVTRLQQQVDQPQRIPDAPRGPMLVRITERYASSEVGEPPSVEVSEVIDASAYLFEQVHVRFRRDSGTVEISAREYGLKSRAQQGQDEDLTLVAIDPRKGSNLQPGTLATVYPLDVDAGPSGGDVPAQQGLYMLLRTFAPPEVAVYEITGPGAELGHYFGFPQVENAPEDIDVGKEPVLIINLYETSDYYGALAGIGPCVQIQPGTLFIGDRVPVLVYGGQHYTMAPVNFNAQCTPCGGTAGAALEGGASREIELAAAGIMMRG